MVPDFFKAMSLLLVEQGLFPAQRTGMQWGIGCYGYDQSIGANPDSWEGNA